MSDDAGGEPGVPLAEIPLHSTNLLTVLDADGVIRYESPAIERILGFEPPALVGEPVADYVHPADRDRVMVAFRSVVAGEVDVEVVEFRHERADGSFGWVESVGSSNATPDGHYVVNTRDVSARRARERALERTNERLEEFATAVSHDLRNPLNVATGRLALVREEPAAAHFDAIEGALDRMSALIDGVLALARAGEALGQVAPVALPAVARAAWATVETRSARLDVGTARTIRADDSRLQQLFENVFRNAVEHGGRAVTVRIGDLADGFYVEDDGPGIPDAERAAVLEAGHSTVGGTGLGLAIVRDIADAHGWGLDATEGPEGGARLEIRGVDVVD